MLPLVIAALAGIARYGAVSYEAGAEHDPMSSTGFVVFGVLLRLGIWGTLIGFALRRDRTARFLPLALLASCILDLVFAFGDLIAMPIEGGFALLQMLILLPAVVMLYTRSSQAWFNRSVTDYAPDVFPRYRRVFTAVATCAGAAVLGMVMLAVWSILSMHIVQTHGPVSFSQAIACPIPLLASAKNIQYHKSRHAVAYKDCVRFEAPVADCLAHARTAASFDPAKLAKFPAPDPSMSAEQREFQSAQISSQGQSFAPWFDLGAIRNGLHGGEAGPGQAQIWIDLDRGIFYYAITD